MLKDIFRLPSTVWLLGLVSLFNDAASDLMYPLIPIYLASVLGVGARVLGLIEGVVLAVNSLLKLFSGVLADRTHVIKGWVVGGYALAALSRPLFAWAANWPTVFALRFADRVGKGLRTSPRDALLAMSVTAGQRGLAFGFHRAMDNAGAVIGPLIAAWLLSNQVDLHSIFLWTAVPGVITVILAFSVREPEREIDPEITRFSWRLHGFPSAFKRYLLVLALFTLGYPSSLFLLLRARDMGVPNDQIPLLWALVSLTAMLFSTGLSAFSDRLGRLRMITVGWLIYAVFLLLLGLDRADTRLLWPLFAFYGLFLAATEGAEKALVADLVPTSLLGTAYGWFNLTTGIMLLPASLVFGWLWQAASPQFAFAFSALSAAAATVLLLFWIPNTKPSIGL